MEDDDGSQLRSLYIGSAPSAAAAAGMPFGRARPPLDDGGHVTAASIPYRRRATTTTTSQCTHTRIPPRFTNGSSTPPAQPSAYGDPRELLVALRPSAWPPAAVSPLSSSPCYASPLVVSHHNTILLLFLTSSYTCTKYDNIL